MLSRLRVRKGQTPDEARRSFDGMLGVSSWGSLVTERREAPDRDPNAPWWWYGEEEASDTFLKSMGVVL